MRLCLVLALLLTFPTTAEAAPGDKAGMTVAAAKWGVPACGLPRLEVSTPAAYLRAHGTGEFDAEPEAWADDSRCAIVINPHFAFAMHTAAKRCHIIVHEWGHLAGHDHSENPRSVMYGEDLVGESQEYLTRKRWRWVAGGAFRPCYAATGTSD